MKRNPTLDAQLRELWQCRSELDDAEQIQLYNIVTSVLQTCKPAILGSLPGDHEDYIQDFLADKVFRLDTLTRCNHCGALCSFFKNYLTDQYRKLVRQKQIGENESTFRTGDEAEASLSLIDQQAATISEHSRIAQALDEAGLQPSAIATSAANWLSDSEDWVRLMVTYHYCQCQASPQHAPISGLAERHAIKSAAHKVKKLGLNWKSEDLHGYDKTIFGKWLFSLGVETRAENKLLILGILQILCFEALSWAEQQRNLQ